MGKKVILLFTLFLLIIFSVIIGRTILSTPKNTTIKTIDTKSHECKQDKDCLLAIRLEACCICPEAVTREELNSTLVEYFPGKDYMSEKTVDCSGVVCGPCKPAMGIVCSNNKCEFKAQTSNQFQD